MHECLLYTDICNHPIVKVAKQHLSTAHQQLCWTPLGLALANLETTLH